MTPTSTSIAAGIVTVEEPVPTDVEPNPPDIDDLGRALSKFLASGADVDRSQIRGLAAALVEQGIGPAACANPIWDGMRRTLLSCSDEDRPWLLDRAIAAQQELWSVFDRAYQLERRAHRQIAASLARTKHETTHILDNIPAHVFAKDTQSRYTAVNRAFCEALGLPRERILSRTDSDLFPTAISDELRRRDREALESGTTSRQETTTELNGEHKTLLITKAPLFDAEGGIIGLVGVALDVSHLKELEHRELTLMLALESSQDAICVMDTSGIILYVNPAFERLTKFPRDEAVGQSNKILSAEGADSQSHERVWRRVSSGKPWRGVWPMRCKDGSEFQSEQSIAPVKDDSGTVTGYVSVARNFNDHKRIMEALEDAVTIKSDFTSMISHELRTPLCAIKEAVDVVADGSAGPTNDHQAQFLGLAKRNVDRLHRLINDVLDFSRLEKGFAAPDIRPHPLNDLVNDVSEKQRPAAGRRGIELTVEPDPRVELVPLDAARITTTVGQPPCTNAIRFCSGPWVRVSTHGNMPMRSS